MVQMLKFYGVDKQNKMEIYIPSYNFSIHFMNTYCKISIHCFAC